MPKSKAARRKKVRRKQGRRALRLRAQQQGAGPERQSDAEATITPARSSRGKSGGQTGR